MSKRVQSPSSINTYKQCPRKYYYQYILKLPTKDNIHLVRGNVTHTVLEQFYEIDPSLLTENYIEELTYYVKNLFNAHWTKAYPKIIKMGLTEEQIVFYYQETIMMLANWLNHILQKLRKEMETKPIEEAFRSIKPAAIEQEFSSNELMVRGFVDYIEEDGNDIKIMDYKTSKKFELTPEYKLQLAIYALLYDKKYGKRPTKAGIWFLKHGEILIDVNEELVKLAKFEIEQIHLATESDSIVDYPKHESPLCRYSTGQCDFYETCFKKHPQNTHEVGPQSIPPILHEKY